MGFTSLSSVLRGWPHTPIPQESFADDACERLRKLLFDVRDAPELVAPEDIASLVRHALRCESAISVDSRLQVPTGRFPWPDSACWQRFNCSILHRPDAGTVVIRAEPWQPKWIPFSEPLSAVERQEKRRHSQSVTADPAISAEFGRTDYLSQAQADSVRAVSLSIPGSTFVIGIPTGGGKSLIGLSVALLGRREQIGVSIVVVPTIALAFDQAAQTKALPMRPQVDVWHSGLLPEERGAIQKRIREGRQRLLYAAPESVVGALAEPLCVAAESGFLRGFIVDEAHLVAQWGHAFRPEFQSMAGLWSNLKALSPKGCEFKTILMTGTLTQDALDTLRTFFGPPEHLKVLCSVFLRPEPDYFASRCPSEDEQRVRVLDLLSNGPRPAILYVTEVVDAKAWANRLRQAGWKRVGCMHGKSSPVDREKLINQWREDKIDVVVATSAFGLGMDKRNVRMVVHACVPETVDRFYQEVGRGGRDGIASTSFLLWTDSDRKTSAKMSQPTLIGAELGLDRWRSVLNASKWKGDLLLANLRAMRPGVAFDGDTNEKWNLRTITLLARMGAVEVQHQRPPELVKAIDESEEAFGERWEKQMEDFWSVCPLKLTTNEDTRNPSFWENDVRQGRMQTLSFAASNWERMNDVLTRTRPLDQILTEVYTLKKEGIDVDPGGRGYPVQLPTNVCRTLGETLWRALPNHGQGTVLVTYRTRGRDERDWKRDIADAIKDLTRMGIREIVAPASWVKVAKWKGVSENPITKIHALAPEGFVIVEALENDDFSRPNFNIPRLTILDGNSAKDSFPPHLFMIRRPLHLIFVPDDWMDPRHPYRSIGEVCPPSSIHLNNLVALLNML